MGTPNFTKEEGKKALREVCGELLEEIAKEDRIMEVVVFDRRRSLDRRIDNYLLTADIDWDTLAKSMTLDEFKHSFAEVLRPEVRKMCAPIRPS